ncbi:MAG: GTPase RsgA, partial [Cyanobacteria bacterium Co-bin13]|nr:GTPase RsgA [Cyanobacteria bacterium Co-bin13]
RHTTTHRHLLRLPSGALLIDTPGMRELQLWATADGLEATFSEVETLAQQCRFRDCQHQQEPGCAVQAAIATGDLDPARLHSYHKLQREQRHLAERQDSLASLNTKRRWNAIHKDQRQAYKGRKQPVSPMASTVVSWPSRLTVMVASDMGLASSTPGSTSPTSTVTAVSPSSLTKRWIGYCPPGIPSPSVSVRVKRTTSPSSFIRIDPPG